ncbi:HEPN domain-containing protein [Fulvivirga sp. M361]|uniref:HEPN domain-containing protein n=1 Tax=Fulvivirga sp. M361 TaxID=2594266 RepID=UPI001179DA54|nr:HEPN domain-containing protein [Fulvivirga sp. M361]TRX56121.1 HEPN domain-containing protein [Fulvivirga sp. M361]
MSITISEKVSKEARKDILELQSKIKNFKQGEIQEERFKAFRLARGVYGQRQQGVQMFRIKLPFGKITAEQLVRLADLSEQYTNGNLHLTTRQNVQLHYIKLDDTPELWSKLEEVGITTREACGNTVRNITASAKAGIDPEEPFDVAPYAQAVFEYFLRYPVNQEMGRKIKMAFSSSERDSAFAFLHDFGFIPRVKEENGQKIRGFKVLVGGGLGAQALLAPTAYEFLHEDEIIPFIEAGLRVFDRYGEREKRFKARLKFLIEEKKGLGIEKFLELVDQERTALPFKTYPIDRTSVKEVLPSDDVTIPNIKISDPDAYDYWFKTNVFEQKQSGFYAVKAKVDLGNIDAERARKLADLVKKYAADDMRITIQQGIIIKYVRAALLPAIYQGLNELNLAQAGAETIADITACPGTDTCNLGVTNSTDISLILEKMIREEFKELVLENDIAIKISGCMNSCGQHMVANIGFHGSSIKNGELVIPAQQVVIGGGVDADGKGFIADKVIKLPSKKIPEALRSILKDYENNAEEAEYFNDYYQRQGKMYFYSLLKRFADIKALAPEDYVDWGHSEQFIPEIGVGECAGVTLDVVGTIINDAQEKLDLAAEALKTEEWASAIYNSYNTLIVSAKALLLSEDQHCNTHIGIIRDFEQYFVQSGKFDWKDTFEETVLSINKNEPGGEFANTYHETASTFLYKVKKFRQLQLNTTDEGQDKVVVDNYYKA